jgi:hypothetical protein
LALFYQLDQFCLLNLLLLYLMLILEHQLDRFCLLNLLNQ